MRLIYIMLIILRIKSLVSNFYESIFRILIFAILNILAKNLSDKRDIRYKEKD